MKKINLLVAVAPLLLVGLFSHPVNADNSWGKYHWNISSEASGTNPLKLGDNLTGLWGISLGIASGRWNEATLVDPDENTVPVLRNEVDGGLSNSNCDPVRDRIEVCNDNYGNNGWLGIASIWATRGRSNHIVQAVVKVNDYYFAIGDDALRDYVMCQEVGHTFGLDHQDTTFNTKNLGSCMDYTSDPAGTSSDFGPLDNRYPNEHDYDEMRKIYSHLNATTTTDDDDEPKGNKGKKPKKAGVADDITPDNPSAWGQAIRQDAQGRNILFERNLANGQVLITYVIWAY